MMSGPPGYAWDWVARQRLVWREARSRLARLDDPVARRYAVVSAKPDVVALLRRDYPTDDVVRGVLRDVVDEVAFLGRTDRAFDDMGLRNAPRGLRLARADGRGRAHLAPATRGHPRGPGPRTARPRRRPRWLRRRLMG